MKILKDDTGTVDGLKVILEEFNKADNIQTIMIISSEANNFTEEEINPVLKISGKHIIGGIFPGVIYDSKKLDKGTIVAGFEHKSKTLIIHSLSSEKTIPENQIYDYFNSCIKDNQTMFVFVDSLSKRINTLIDGLYNNLGCSVNYIGGGAGTLKFEQKPCLFTNDGLIADAAVVSLIDTKSSLGVAHGWKPISEAFKVTEVENNTIISLNWEPAFNVYQREIEKHVGSSFDRKDLFSFAVAYPFGIAKLDDEMCVRDVLKLDENGGLVCAGDIPRGAFVYILNASSDELISAAASARNTAMEGFDTEGNGVIFLVDCIGRVLFLDNDFERELSAIKNCLFLFGFLSIGEIANTGQSYLEFYNKTVVVSLLRD